MIEKDNIKKIKDNIDRLKLAYKNYAGGKDSSLLSEDEKKEKGEIYQDLLENEYVFQEYRTEKCLLKIKKGDWIVEKGRWGYKRVKVENDNLCGW